MIHVSDVVVRTVDIGFAGDNSIPAMDTYAKAGFFKKSEGTIGQKQQIAEWIEASLGGNN